jgi:hypothetical protein
MYRVAFELDQSLSAYVSMQAIDALDFRECYHKIGKTGTFTKYIPFVV